MNPERVGRDGLLRLRFERRGKRTVLAQSRFTLPLQILIPVEMDNGGAYLMLLNPTGGVLGGDRLVTEIVLGPGAHVCLTTPSATRIYRTLRDPAILETRIALGEGAILEYSPDHVIPHIGSALRQSTRIEMAPGSRAIVLDALASGRVAHGERWKFTEVDLATEIHARDRPVYVNRTKIEPARTFQRQVSWAMNFDYMMSLGLFADGFESWPQALAYMNAALATVPEVTGGASLLSRGGCVARYVARSAAQMTRANQKLWDAARRALLDLPPFDHRKY